MILHAVWTRRQLHFWVEGRLAATDPPVSPPQDAIRHPRARPATEVAELVAGAVRAVDPDLA